MNRHGGKVVDHVTAPAPPATPPPQPRVAAAPAGMTLARWLYVDERRTHEVVAGIRPGAPPQFVVRESAYANDDPAEVIEHSVPLPEAWEAQLRVSELEKRLSLVGRYWRHDVATPGWARLRAPAFESLDLRPLRGGAFDGRVSFHHFAKKGARDVVIALVPRPTSRGARYLVARCDYAHPLAEEGDLTVLHAHLPAAPATSILAREHIELDAAGYRKLVTGAETAVAAGAPWESDLRLAHESMLRRLAEGRLGRPSKGDASAPVDPVFTDYLANLNDPRIIALHAQFLAPDEEAAALAGGEPMIRKLVSEKRRAHPGARDNMMLTLLEASLLARDGLASSTHRVDPEVAALVRRFAYYL